MVTMQTAVERASIVSLDDEIEKLEAQLKLKRGVRALIVEFEEKVTEHGFDSFAQFVENYIPNGTKSPNSHDIDSVLEPVASRMRSSGEKRKRIKITAEVIADMKNRKNSGDSAMKVSKDLNISYLTVLKYLKPK